MRIALHANPDKGAASDLARDLLERLQGRAELIVTEETARAVGSGVSCQRMEAMDADLLVAIGGDGTFLHCLGRSALPLFAVNAGTVGFLAEVSGRESATLDSALERILAGRYFLEERMKLSAHIGPESLPDAVNEVVVHTSQVAKMRHFGVAIDSRPIGRLRADGLIVATPTGSTSYALSAMGPVVEPGIEAIIVAALAPFQAMPRAVLVDPLRTVGVRLLQAEKDGVVVIDGQSEHRLGGGEEITIARSPRKAVLVRLGSPFLHGLLGKGILPWAEEGPRGDDADLSPPA